jgi:hypothetical protein
MKLYYLFQLPLKYPITDINFGKTLFKSQTFKKIKISC